MAEVIVIGGGVAGMAAAARLAKLGHSVTLIERTPQLGGAVGTVKQDGFQWDSGATHTVLPAVVRDLFRKSGRPADREIELIPLPAPQQHRFARRRRRAAATVDFPTGSRAEQLQSLRQTLGEAAAQAWVSWVDSYSSVWEALRQEWFERPWDPQTAPPQVLQLLMQRRSLYRAAKRHFRDPRLLRLATYDAVFAGHDPANVPAWWGVWSYVAQNFGTWTLPQGMGHLSKVLQNRLHTRKVDVLTNTAARDIVVEGGAAVAVQTTAGAIDADIVVNTIDPRLIPALAPYVARTMPAMPPTIAHLGLAPAAAELLDPLPHEVVFHGDPMLVLRTNGHAPGEQLAWTILARGRISEDVVTALSRRGLRLQEHVVTRVDRSVKQQIEANHSSSMGVVWQGRNTLRHQLGNRTPITGCYQAGAHTSPGAGIPGVGLSAAIIAEIIGKAPRG